VSGGGWGDGAGTSGPADAAAASSSSTPPPPRPSLLAPQGCGDERMAALSAVTGRGALERALLDVVGVAAHHVASFVW